jgi:hypothetical protein
LVTRLREAQAPSENFRNSRRDLDVASHVVGGRSYVVTIFRSSKVNNILPPSVLHLSLRPLKHLSIELVEISDARRLLIGYNLVNLLVELGNSLG